MGRKTEFVKDLLHLRSSHGDGHRPASGEGSSQRLDRSHAVDRRSGSVLGRGRRQPRVQIPATSNTNPYAGLYDIRDTLPEVAKPYITEAVVDAARAFAHANVPLTTGGVDRAILALGQHIEWRIDNGYAPSSQDVEHWMRDKVLSTNREILKEENPYQFQ